MVKKNTQRKRRIPVDLDTRLAIAKYIDEGLTILQIANILGRHHNVIYYELNHRSQKDGTYDPVKAHKMAKEIKKMPEKKKQEMRALNPAIKKYIEQKLSLKWSPRQISSEMENDIGYYVSFSTIYRYINTGQVRVNKVKDMRRGGKKYTKTTEERGKIKIGHHRTISSRSNRSSKT